MPYNPGVQNTAGASIGQGLHNMGQNALRLYGMFKQEADQTNEMRSTLSSLYPDRKDSFKAMDGSQLKGFMTAEAMRAAQEAQAQAREQSALAIAHARQQMANESAMGQAMKEAQPPMQTRQESLYGYPSQLGMFGYQSRTQGAPEPSALVGAMMNNPGAESSPAGRSFLGHWVQHSGKNMQPEMLEMGGLHVINQPGTGQFQVDPRDTVTAKMKAHPPAVPKDPGKAPLLSPDGKFYLDTHLNTWKPLPKQGGFEGMGEALGLGKGGDGKGKELDEATAAAILREVGFDKDKAREEARKRGYHF